MLEKYCQVILLIIHIYFVPRYYAEFIFYESIRAKLGNACPNYNALAVLIRIRPVAPTSKKSNS